MAVMATMVPWWEGCLEHTNSHLYVLNREISDLHSSWNKHGTLLRYHWQGDTWYVVLDFYER